PGRLPDGSHLPSPAGAPAPSVSIPPAGKDIWDGRDSPPEDSCWRPLLLPEVPLPSDPLDPAMVRLQTGPGNKDAPALQKAALCLPAPQSAPDTSLRSGR